MTVQITAWVVTEGIAGTENQCLGVAEALGLTPVVKRIALNEPWKTLSPYIGCEGPRTFRETSGLIPPWPDLVIASGRKSIPASRYIKKMSGGRSFTVQLQDPRYRRDDFDLLAVPAHDPAAESHADNIFVTQATPNRITPARLAEARAHFSEIFSALPAQRIGVLIGGSAGAQTLTPAMVRHLTAQLQALVADEYGLMITTSRRTGEENKRILQSELHGPHIHFWTGAGENPYFGILAHADALIVTSDSMSMISEAATTGKPVYTVNLNGGKKRHLKMQESLRAHGMIRNFEGRIDEWTYEPLADAKAVADEIRRKSGLF